MTIPEDQLQTATPKTRRPAIRAGLRRACSLWIVIATIGGCSGGSNNPAASSPAQATSSAVLTITPVAQQAEDWCYAASTQMIFQYYGLPNLNSSGNYQCGVVEAFNGYIYPQYPQCAIDCTQCSQVGGGSLDAINYLIDQYGVLAIQLGIPSRVLTSTETYSALSQADVSTEILAGRPILAGISPGGYPLPDLSTHAVLIVGFDYSGAAPALIINDPFPYDAVYTLLQNPYVMAGGIERMPGQYEIPYDSFISSLVWANSIYQIH